MILSIIIPVYNEEKTVLKSLQSLKNLNKNLFQHEVIVVNDGSQDSTGKILNENKNLYDKLLTNETNKGKGFSIKKGIIEAKGTHIICHDADLEYNPKDILKFEKIFADFNADGVLGSRFNYSDYTRSHNILNKFANHLITLTFNLLYNTTFTDIYSCYLLFKADLKLFIEFIFNISFESIGIKSVIKVLFCLFFSHPKAKRIARNKNVRFFNCCGYCLKQI